MSENTRTILEHMIDADPLRMRRRMLSLGVHPGDADDIAQAAMLRAWRSIDAVQTPQEGTVCAWLDAIARTTAIDSARAAGRACGTELADDTAERDNGQQESCRELTSVMTAIEELPLELRTPLLLTTVDGLTANDVAELMGISPENVRQRVTRARRRLRKLDLR